MENIKIISAKEYTKINGKIPDQEEVWDKISDLWNEYRKEPFDAVAHFLNKISSNFGKSSDKSESAAKSENSKNAENSKNTKDNLKIIDLGCGSGRNMIKDNHLEYYGVDISANQLKAAKINAKEKGIIAEFFKGSADKLDKSVFKNEMFDYGLFIATLHCIKGEKERENALKEFYRVLKKGAEAVITVWNSEDNRFNGLAGDIYMSWKKNGKEHYRYYYLYDKDELINLLKKVGFKIAMTNEKETDRFSKKNWIFKISK